MELGTSSHPLILYKGIIHPVDENPDHISGKQTDDPLPEFQIILFRFQLFQFGEEVAWQIVLPAQIERCKYKYDEHFPPPVTDIPVLLVLFVHAGFLSTCGGIQPSQSDYFLATRGPGHGDFHVLVLAPASVQEMADLTQKAFRLAFEYRMPAMLLADGTMGQMMEPVVLPEETVLEKSAPDWAVTGTECKRPHNIINSLYLSPAELEQKNIERFERYARLAEKETMWEEFMMEDAEVCIVSCGITARVSRNAIVEARKRGIKAGMIRPITLWPFPDKPLLAAADKVKGFVCVELNMGQMKQDVELAVRCKKPVSLCRRVGGMIPTPDEVLASIQTMAEGGANA